MFDRLLKIAASQGPQTTAATAARRSSARGSRYRPRIGRKSTSTVILHEIEAYLATRALHSNDFGYEFPDFMPEADSGPATQMFLLLGGASYSETQNCFLFCLIFSTRISVCRF